VLPDQILSLPVPLVLPIPATTVKRQCENSVSTV
jgi:hypothetical protein